MKMSSPGGDDIVGRFERLERRIDEATRGTDRKDAARIYFGRSTVALPVGSDDGNKRLQDSWYGVPEFDTTGHPPLNIPGTIAKVNVSVTGGLATYFEIPYSGRWRVRIDAAFARGPNNGYAGVWMKLNDDVSVGYTPGTLFGGNNTYLNSGPAYCRVAAQNDRLLSKGDRISFGFWTPVAGNYLLGVQRAAGDTTSIRYLPLSPTYAEIEYIGPT